MQASVGDFEAPAFVIRSPLAALVERGVIHAVASVLALAVALALSLLAPQIGVAAAVSGPATVGLLVVTLLKGRHDVAPALHG